ERDAAVGFDLIVAAAIDIDLQGRGPGREIEIAGVDRADACARTGGPTAVHGYVADAACAAEFRGAVDGGGAGWLLTEHKQRTAVHSGRPGVGIVRVQREGALARFRQAARAADDAAETGRSVVAAGREGRAAQQQRSGAGQRTNGFDVAVEVEVIASIE